jgi:alkylhydroperoxidase/carboxymuconolactone decarboxylase family protein YurZ
MMITKRHETGTVNQNDDEGTKANDLRPPKGSRQEGVNRRQFMSATGTLVGAVAVGGLAAAHAQSPRAGKGSHVKKPASDHTGTKRTANRGPWDPALEKLRDWDPKWAEACEKMTTNPWTGGVLPRKTVELISVALNAACTNLDQGGTRRHIKAALKLGVTQEETMEVLKLCVVQGVQACNLGVPILAEELENRSAKKP